MSDAVDHPQPAAVASRLLALMLVGAPESPKRYLAMQWGALTLQIAFLMGVRHWIATPQLRLAAIALSLVVSVRWLGARRPPSLQLRRPPGKGALLSGHFRERRLALHEAVTPVSADLVDGVLTFRIHRDGMPETLSLRGDAFGRIPPAAMLALSNSVLAGDETALLSDARPLGLSIRERPRVIGVSSIEPRWLAPTLLAGSATLGLMAYLIHHFFLR